MTGTQTILQYSHILTRIQNKGGTHFWLISFFHFYSPTMTRQALEVPTFLDKEGQALEIQIPLVKVDPQASLDKEDHPVFPAKEDNLTFLVKEDNQTLHVKEVLVHQQVRHHHSFLNNHNLLLEAELVFSQ